MVTAYTIVSPDGVVGLNGRYYLEDDDGQVMLFKDVIEAQKFIADAGEDPFDEYIAYTEIDDDGNEYDIDYDGERTK